MSKGVSIIHSLLSDRRFLVACGVMLVATVSWRMVVKGMGVALTKAPVPWAAGVVVNEDSRNTSFPTKILPYVLVEEDGELDHDKDGKAIKDGKADGEVIMNSETLNALGMGKGADKDRIPKRQSNWYLSRVYYDTREPVQSPFRYWRLNITYFTGGLDNVPHIGENCLTAGGANISEASSRAVAVRDMESPWNGSDGKQTFRRILYAFKFDIHPRLMYYIFSVNGEPEDSNQLVRTRLMNPFKRHVYFAKIEVGPYWPVVDIEEGDRRTEEFIRTCLPVALKSLPMPSDVQKLESAQQE